MASSPLTSLTETTQTGLLVVDDHDLVRLGLRTLVQTHACDGAQSLAIFEARTLQEALALFEEHQARIDLVLLDLRLPDTHGLSGLATFVARFPSARIVVLSGETDPSLASKAVAGGAIAYLSKSTDLTNLMDYIGSKSPVGDTRPSDLDAQPVPLVRAVKTLDGSFIELSARQSEAFDFLLAGHSNKEIADKMHLSEGTVKNHISTLLLLFGVRSRAQLISQLR